MMCVMGVSECQNKVRVKRGFIAQKHLRGTDTETDEALRGLAPKQEAPR